MSQQVLVTSLAIFHLVSRVTESFVSETALTATRVLLFSLSTAQRSAEVEKDSAGNDTGSTGEGPWPPGHKQRASGTCRLHLETE